MRLTWIYDQVMYEAAIGDVSAEIQDDSCWGEYHAHIEIHAELFGVPFVGYAVSTSVDAAKRRAKRIMINLDTLKRDGIPWGCEDQP